MGFKCPVCMEDFGCDKAKWTKHIKESHAGAGDDIVSVVKKAAEPDADEFSKYEAAEGE